MNGIDIKIDEELRDLLPPLTPEEYDMLEDSVTTNGIMEKIRVWINPEDENSYIIDGHNRYSICNKHNIEITNDNILGMKFNPDTKDRVIEWMIMNQMQRRNLTLLQKYEIIQKHKNLFIVHGKLNMSSGGKGSTTLPKVNTRKEMAKLVGTSEGNYTKLDKIFSSDNDEVKEKVKAGKITINKAFEEISPDKKEIENTGDCDKLIDDIEEQIKKLVNKKSELFVIRQQKFDESPDTDLRCEVEEVLGDSIIRNLGEKYKFYLVKGDNRILCFEISKTNITDTDFINMFLRIEKLNNIERNIVLSKIFETQKKFIEQEEIFKKEDAENQKKDKEKREKLNQNSADAFKELSDTLNYYIEFEKLKSNPLNMDIVKNIINLGYKALAKKYHPDIVKDDGQQMQIINQVKDILDKVIS